MDVIDFLLISCGFANDKQALDNSVVCAGRCLVRNAAASTLRSHRAWERRKVTDLTRLRNQPDARASTEAW